jgi:Zn-dependent peptidase ImmA (M78 family)
MHHSFWNKLNQALVDKLRFHETIVNQTIDGRNSMIGQRLRIARAAAGLSLRDLEDKIGNLVTAQALSKYEHDETMPNSTVLMAVSDALGVSPNYLLASGEITLEDVEFRKAELSARDAARVEARVIEQLERYLAIEDVLNVQSIEWDQPREAPFPVKELADADRAARMLRMHWQLGLDALPNFAEFLEEKGIKVLMAEMPREVDGLMCKVKRQDKASVPVVIINQHEWVSGERERFTLAHEIGHLVLECDEGVNKEKASNRFAAAFLMPAEILWAEVGKHRDSLSIAELIELKRIFGVSLQMLVYRCRDLKIIEEPLFKALFDEFKEKGWRDPPYQEPASVKMEFPRRFQRLCFRALAEKAISESKAAELLGTNVRKLSALMEHGATEH